MDSRECSSWAISDELCSFNMSSVALLCLTDLAIKWDDLCHQLTNNNFDRNDYAAMKFLILFDAENPKLRDKQKVMAARQKVRQAWIDYRRHLVSDPGAPLMACLNSIR